MVFSKPAANLTSKYVATVYHSDTYKVILDIETGLFSQRMAHVLTILQRKLKEGKIAARWNRRIAALTHNRPPREVTEKGGCFSVNVARISTAISSFWLSKREDQEEGIPSGGLVHPRTRAGGGAR